MEEIFKVNGNINEWIKKSETCLKQHGFDSIAVFGLKGEIEATYKVFDNITIRFTPLLDGKVELNIKASNPQLITIYKNGILTASKPKLKNKNQLDDEKLIHYAPKFEQSPDFYGEKKRTSQRPKSTELPKTKNSGGCFKVLLIGFLILFVLAMLYSCVNNSLSENTSTSSNNSSFSLFGKSNWGIGETADINNVNVTLTNIYISYGDDMFFIPKDGYMYLFCEFLIDNQSANNIHVSSVMCFETYCDGYSIQQELAGSALIDKGQLDGAVASGKKMNGVITYQVPISWNELEINFTPDFWSGKTGKFIVKNSQN